MLAGWHISWVLMVNQYHLILQQLFQILDWNLSYWRLDYPCNSCCYLSICRHIDNPPLSLHGRHSKMRGKGILGVWEMPGVHEEGGTSLRSARISLLPTSVMQATGRLQLWTLHYTACFYLSDVSSILGQRTECAYLIYRLFTRPRSTLPSGAGGVLLCLCLVFEQLPSSWH